MIEYGDFRENLNHIINDYNSYSKKDLYVAFLQMTERYLNEMVNTLNFEKVIIENLGEERGSELIEMIATSSPDIQDLDSRNSTEEDQIERIKLLIAHIETEFSNNTDSSEYGISVLLE